jgi:RHS repeat-associated protein
MLLSDQHATYEYDLLGNLTAKHTGEGVVYFAYDAENRLSRVTMPDGMVIEYGYDPMGRRVRRTVSGASTYFVMADEDMIAEFEGEAMAAKYIHGPGTDEPWALVNRKGSYYYHADGLGSIVAITDDARRVVQTYEYDFFGNGAFGGLHDMKNRIKQPYAFTGREFDSDTRMYYYRARYYDPSTGRFTQQDPIGYNGGLNLYAYVGGNPVNATDPWGEVLVSLAEGMKIVQEAKTWIGTPYQSPGMTRAGIDCSRLVWRVYNDLNYTYNYAYTGVFATRTEFKKVTTPQEGDVVLFSGHMGIYNNGALSRFKWVGRPLRSPVFLSA